MKFNFGRLPDFSDPRDISEFLAYLERSFGRIHIDDQIIIGGGTPILKHLSATATWNPGNLVAGAQTSTTVALTGAALGDEATCSFSLDLQVLQLTAYVSAANVVTALLVNNTAGAIDLASGTLRVSVWQH